MTEPSKKPPVRINPLFLDEEEYRLAEEPTRPRPDTEPPPRELPQWIQEAVRETPAAAAAQENEAQLAPPWSMLSGIATFPFYLTTLGTWMATAFGLMVTGWLLMFWLAHGADMGMMSARLLGLPPLLSGTLTLAYAFTCCLMIIQDTSHGVDAVDIRVGFAVKEWVWNLFHMIALGLQAGLVGFVVQKLGFSETWWPGILGTLAAFPFVVLGALAAEGAWAPLALPLVLRSLGRTWWAWGLFYAETTPLIVGWILLTAAGVHGYSPWSTPAYAGPLLATIILIYARLLGRLAGCIAAADTPTAE